LIVNKYRYQKNRNYKVNEKLKLKIIENYKKLNPENISNTTTKNKSKQKPSVLQRGYIAVNMPVSIQNRWTNLPS